MSAAPATKHRSTASAADAAAWHVRLLGVFEIDNGSQRLLRLRSRAATLLLARLAMAPGRDHAREELSAMLWPDAQAVASRSRLRQTLSLLKAVLEPAGASKVLHADRRVVRVLPGALWCDAVAFEQAQRAGHVDLARSLYGGELLPGFYDDWVADERLRLQAVAERVLDADAAVRTPATAPGPAGVRATVPTTRSLPVLPGNPGHAPPPPTNPVAPGLRLPQYLTRLIGADQQGARLRALATEHRLVVVLGAGGAGKTRLAVEVARLLCAADTHDPPVTFERTLFVSLVGATRRTEVLDRIALALRVSAGSDTVDALLQAMDGRALLVLLDNAEQLDDEATAVIAYLAERLPAAHWLITSRRPLALDGERDFHVDTLELPALNAPLPEVVMNPAVALFIDRARAHRPDFHVNATHRDAMVALVRWLDGLPLAIELAASHARVLGPAELLSLLQAARAQRDGGSLSFLSRRGPRSGSDARHASMQAVVAWSWALLPAELQGLLSALCLLPAGSTLPAAALLAGKEGAPLGLAATQALLDDLMAHSALRAAAGQDGQWRYTPMEPLREFVLAHHAPATLQQGRRRVLDGLLAWAKAMPATPSLPSVRDELPNLMQALQHAPADGNANLALQLVLLLQPAWGEISLPAGLLDSLARVLQSPGLDESLAAGAHSMAATSYQEAGRRDEVRLHIAQALALPCTDAAMRAFVLSRAARMAWRIDKDAPRARALIAEGLALARASQSPYTEAGLLTLEGHIASVVDGDAARGKDLSAQGLALWARSGNRHQVNAGRYNVAVQTMEAGDALAALDEFEALSREGRELQDWDLAAGALEARGTALQRLGRWAESATSIRESLVVAWDGLEMQATVYALWNIAPALARLRLGTLAAQTMGAAEQQWAQRFGQTDASDRRDLRRVRRFARTLLGAHAAQKAWQDGASRSLGQAVQAVLAGLPATDG